jgi:hypothetical protein
MEGKLDFNKAEGRAGWEELSTGSELLRTVGLFLFVFEEAQCWKKTGW